MLVSGPIRKQSCEVPSQELICSSINLHCVLKETNFIKGQLFTIQQRISVCSLCLTLWRRTRSSWWLFLHSRTDSHKNVVITAGTKLGVSQGCDARGREVQGG